MTSIELENVGLSFHVSRNGPARFRELLLDRLAPREQHRVTEVRALYDVNLKLAEGDRVGILGPNGAGKSTLLKVLADIYPPTSGCRRVRGRVSALFDIILGFEMDATGWENIAYRSYLQGESRKSVRQKMQSIADFSELGDALNRPVRYYSDGMRTRLGFAISTAIEPDILLIDEALNAGDAGFQDKARARISNVLSSARIVVAVSHDLESLRRLCNRCVWLDHGTVRASGSPDEIIAAYLAHFHPAPALAA